MLRTIKLFLVVSFALASMQIVAASDAGASTITHYNHGPANV